MTKEETGTGTRKPLLQIKKKTVKRVAIYGLVAAGALYGIDSCSGSTTTRIIKSYVDALLGKYGIERTFESPSDNIEAKISSTFHDVREVFTQHANQMKGGLYTGPMFDIQEETEGVEKLFMENAPGKEKGEYAKRMLDPARIEMFVVAYGENVSHGEAVKTVVAIEKNLEAYLGTVLNIGEREQHYLDLALMVLEKGWLSVKGYQSVLTETITHLDPETIAETVAPTFTTPDARSMIVSYVMTMMSPEERTAAMGKVAENIPPEEYNAMVLSMTPYVTSDGYKTLEKQVSDRKWDDRFAEGEKITEKIKEYVKR